MLYRTLYITLLYTRLTTKECDVAASLSTLVYCSYTTGHLYIVKNKNKIK